MEVRSIEMVVKALNDAKVKYLVVGGVAVVAHGYERFTRDLDLVIGLEAENIRRKQPPCPAACEVVLQIRQADNRTSHLHREVPRRLRPEPRPHKLRCGKSGVEKRT